LDGVPANSLHKGGEQRRFPDLDSSAITQATAITHAVPFDPGSTDAAISTILQPGAYTAVVSGNNGGTGTSLVEVYEADGIDSAAKLVNISTRSVVKSGDNVQIAGVIVGGSRPKNVLIRANGPQLANYGVTGLLNDPVLSLYAGGTKIAENDDWGTDAANVTAATSAAQIPPFAINSKDAALLATLSPGTGYSAIVSGKGSSTGVVLIEVYEMP
jgi:hypothetical protein